MPTPFLQFTPSVCVLSSFLRETLVLLAHLVALEKTVLRECAVMLVPQVDQEMLVCVELLAPLERKEKRERMVPLLVTFLNIQRLKC